MSLQRMGQNESEECKFTEGRRPGLSPKLHLLTLLLPFCPTSWLILKQLDLLS